MKKLLLFVAGSMWFGLVFVITFWLTFPSDAIVDRLRYEVHERSNGEYSLELDSISPWWVGAHATGVKLYQQPRSLRGADDEGPKLVFMGRDVRVAVGLMSLVNRAPALSGSVTFVEGTMDYAIASAPASRGDGLVLSQLSLSATDFPVADLAMLAGAEMTGTGGLDIEVDLNAPEGMQKAEGAVSIRGSQVVLSDVALPQVGNLGMDIPLDEIDLTVKVASGKADIRRGIVRSPLLQAELSGDVTLRDELARSTMRVEIAIDQLGDELKAFAPLLDGSGAKGTDDKYHFECRGAASRPSCGPQRSSSAASRSSRNTRPRPTPRPSPRSTTTDDERQKRRDEIRERLRQRREASGEEGDEIDDEELDEEYEDDEEFLDDELDDEEFEDDEEFLDEEFED